MRTRIALMIALLYLPAVLVAAEPARVFVTVLPQQTFVEAVGGPRVQVEALVGPGYSPHTYEPTPGQIARLADADIYLGIGLPVEAAWMKRIRAVNPDIRFIDLAEGIERRQIEEHTHEEEQAHREGHAHEEPHRHRDEPESELDPHVWTSPRLVMRMAERIADTLATMDPSHAPDYQRRLAGFTAELERLDSDIRAQLSGLEHRRFMVYHPAWGYFADAYGLVQVPIESEGKEPGPKRLAALIDQARRNDVRLILAQPQMSTKAAEQVAREIGGRVEVIDTLSPDYATTLRTLTRLLTAVDR